MRTRTHLVLAMLAVLAVVATACSSDDADTTPTAVPTTEATATTPADPMATAAPASSDPAVTPTEAAPAEPIPTEQNPTGEEATPDDAAADDAAPGSAAALTFGTESPLEATACEQSGGVVLVTSTAGDQVRVQGGVDDAAMTYLFEGAEIAAETTTIEAPADDVTRYVGTFDGNETLGTESITAEFNVGLPLC